ncbi:MAG: UDP-3-O-(3-hydroxymyristoyl)glucosamine N-acyltransferase [bacterium]
MKATLAQLAELVQGEVCGDPFLEIHGISSPELAGPKDITFVVSPRHEHRLEGTKAAAVMVPDARLGGSMCKIVVPRVYLAYARVAAFFHPWEPPEFGVSPEAWVHPEASLGTGVIVYPFVWIGRGAQVGDRAVLYPMVCVGEGCQIGEDTILYPGVVMYPGCSVGKRVIVHAGTVIGSDGFGYARDGTRSVKIPQLGTVRIEDDVEIGANVAVDRGSFGATWIQRGVKMDNLVQIGHNVVVGEDAILAGQVGLAGSVQVGKAAVLAGQVGVANHLKIGEGAVVGSKSGVAQDVPAGGLVSGIPAIPHRNWLKSSQVFGRLPELMRRIRDIEKRLEHLERRGGDGRQ